MEQLAELMSTIDEIKEKISDEEYVKLTGQLKNVNDVYGGLYHLVYYEQEFKLQPQNNFQDTHYMLDIKKKNVVTRFYKKDFTSEEEINDYVRMINNNQLLNIGGINLNFTKQDESPIIIKKSVDMKHLASNLDDNNRADEDLTLVKYTSIIPISIKKV